MSGRLDTATAEHEAAHVVVGLALGLRLRRATASPSPLGKRGIACGYVWFYSDRKYLAQAIMLCAGVIWDRENGFAPCTTSAGDRAQAARLVSRRDLPTCERLAAELLGARRRAHARVASELLDQSLGPADIERLVLE